MDITEIATRTGAGIIWITDLERLRASQISPRAMAACTAMDVQPQRLAALTLPLGG